MAKKSNEIYKGQRNKEKRLFFRTYRTRIIYELYVGKFFQLFGNRCFKCGLLEEEVPQTGPRILCIDHHIPMALGGHLVAGNLVSLCRRCNGEKLDRHPSVFYSADELERLQPLLDAQASLLSFQMDEHRFFMDTERYLSELGIPDSAIHAAIHDPEFVGYIGESLISGRQLIQQTENSFPNTGLIFL